MLLQSARIRPARWEETLDLFLRRVDRTPLRWFLYGSGALAVRGIDIQPGDLDFWVSDSQRAGRIFEDLLVEPVTTSGEMSGPMADPGQDPRGAPDLDPLWLMLDLTPEGRGTNWYPTLDY